MIVLLIVTKEDLVRSVRASNELDNIIHKIGDARFLQMSYEAIKGMLDEAMIPYLEQLPQEPVLMA